MKKLFGLLIVLGFLSIKVSGITNISLPYLVDTASIPKVRYVDKNDSALKTGVNNLGDTVNAASGTGILLRTTSPTIAGAPVFSGLTASLPIFTNGSKALVSNAMTGTGSVVMSASPTLTGTLAAASGTYSGTLGVTGIQTNSANIFMPTLGTGLWFGNSGSFGSGILKDASSTISVRNGSSTARGTLDTLGNWTFATPVSLSSTLGVTGITTATGNINVNGAANTVSVGVSVHGKYITTDGGFGFLGFGSGVPSGGPAQWVALNHNGTNGILSVSHVGSSYVPLLIQNGGATAITVDAAANTQIGGTLRVTGAVTLSNLSSGRVPVVSTSGLINQDNLYWDAATDRLGVGSGASSPGASLDIASPVIGGDLTARLYNSDNTNGSSHATLQIVSGGSLGGDAKIRYLIDGLSNWSEGIDNSTTNDDFVISRSALLGTNNAVSFDGASGAATFTAAPVFSSGTASQTMELTAGKALTTVAQTGTGSYVKATSPTLVTPALGAATATSITTSGLTTATGGLTLGAAFVDKVTSLSSNTTLTSAHSTIFASTAGGSITLTLPAASGNDGLTYTIYKTGSSSNTVTVDGNASETIGGALTVVLAGNVGNTVLTIVCNGFSWQIRQLYDEGTFTFTASGMTTSPTGTACFVRTGSQVTLYIPSISGTSNNGTFAFDGIPSALWAARQQYFKVPRAINGGGAITTAEGSLLNADGSLYFFTTGGGLWTTSLTKSIEIGFTITYTLQ